MDNEQLRRNNTNDDYNPWQQMASEVLNDESDNIAEDDGASFGNNTIELADTDAAHELAGTGISLEDLVEADLIYPDSEILSGEHFQFSEAYDVVHAISETNRLLKTAIEGNDRLEADQYAQILDVFNNIMAKRKNGKELTPDDYNSMHIQPFESNWYSRFPLALAQRIWFGNPSDSYDRLEKTSNALQNCTEHSTELHLEAMKYLDNEWIKDDEKGTLRKLLGDVCRRDLPQHLEDLKSTNEWSYDDGSSQKIKSMILRSCNSVTICLAHDKMNSADISDEEMLSAVFCTPFEKSYQLYPNPAYKLGRTAVGLKGNGFSDESIVKVIHDNKIHADDEAIAKMREAGISDEDIAYSYQAYMSYDMSETAAGRAGFSEQVLLSAAIRELREQQRLSAQKQK